MKKIKKVTFVFILSLVLAWPHSNGVSAYTSQKEVHINRSFLGDNVRAKKEGEICKKVKEEYGVKNTVKDTFTKASSSGEEHIREQILELDLTKISNDSTIAENVKNMFGVQVVNADTLSMTKTKTDITVVVKIKLTVKYVLSTYNGLEYVRITKATGSLIGLGSNGGLESGVSIVSNKYTVGVNGFTKKNGWKQYSKNGTSENKAGAKWVFEPSGWKAVASGASAVVGAYQTVKLNRGNSTWTVKIENYYVQ